MFKRIATLIRKDFLEFCFGKSWIIVLMMPVFIFFIYAVIYKQTETINFTIAYTPNTDSALIEILAKTNINLRLFRDQSSAKSALDQGKVAGVILQERQSGQLSLLVDQTKTQEALYIVNSINSALIKKSRNPDAPHLDLIYTDDRLSVKWLSFPVWLLQIILTVCLLQMVAAVADEKEKQTFHSLLISPLSIKEYLYAKLLWYTLLGVGALLFTALLTKAPLNLWCVFLFGSAGSLTFGALALLIGLTAPTPLFARALATVTYLIAALPLMVRDLSFTWKEYLSIFPSFLIFKGFTRALLLNPSHSEIIFLLIGLLVQAIVLFYITQYYLQNRADF